MSCTISSCRATRRSVNLPSRVCVSSVVARRAIDGVIEPWTDGRVQPCDYRVPLGLSSLAPTLETTCELRSFERKRLVGLLRFSDPRCGAVVELQQLVERRDELGQQ